MPSLMRTEHQLCTWFCRGGALPQGLSVEDRHTSQRAPSGTSPWGKGQGLTKLSPHICEVAQMLTLGALSRAV